MEDSNIEKLGTTPDEGEDKVSEVSEEGSEGKEDEAIEYTVNTQGLDYLFSFLEDFDVINYVLAGYFNNVVTSFVNGEHKGDIISYFFEKESHANNCITHIYCRSIAILFSNFLNFQIDEVRSFNSKAAMDAADQIPDFLEKRIALYKKLVNRLLASSDPEVIDNIAFIFEEFLKKCGDIRGSEKIFDALFFNNETLSTFFKIIYSSRVHNNSKTAIICHILIQVLSTLTEKRESTDNNYDIEKKYFDKKLEESNNDLTQIIVDNIEKIIECIEVSIEEN